MKFNQRIVTTPQIQTEVSNLAGQLTQPAKAQFFASLQRVIPKLSEQFKASATPSASDVFVRFGLTDASITEAAAPGMLVLTDDFALSNYLSSHGHKVINFNHLRRLG